MHKSNFIFGLTILFCSCANETSTIPEDELKNREIAATETLDTLIQDFHETSAEPYSERHIADFIQAVLSDDIALVTDYIDFPLMRNAPLAAIQNITEFENYYPTLFDSTLKTKLQSHLDEPDIIDMSSSNGTVGILNGLIWFNDQGSEIVSINYESAAEVELHSKLTEYVKNNMHPILRKYDYNIFLGRTEEGLFRIDETEKGLRYASWYGDQTMLDEPDFILWGGVSEKQGTAGGWTTVFDKVDTQYILDEVAMAQNPEDEGLFLIIKDEGEITSKLPVTEVLNPRDELVPR